MRTRVFLAWRKKLNPYSCLVLCLRLKRSSFLVQVYDLFTTQYGSDKKGDDSFNFFWIGMLWVIFTFAGICNVSATYISSTGCSKSHLQSYNYSVRAYSVTVDNACDSKLCSQHVVVAHSSFQLQEYSYSLGHVLEILNRLYLSFWFRFLDRNCIRT